MATRFYLSDEGMTIAPSMAVWDDVDEAIRRALVTDKTGFPVSGGVLRTENIDWTSGNTALAYQGVSGPMDAGIVFTSATLKSQVRMNEGAAQDNVVERVRVWIVSEDGAAERVVLLALGGYGNESELETSATNETVLDGDATGAIYTTQAGDRLVVELGFTDVTGTTPIAGLNYQGNSGTADLPEDETTTTALSSWFETSVDITFGGGGGGVTPTRTLLGVGV